MFHHGLWTCVGASIKHAIPYHCANGREVLSALRAMFCVVQLQVDYDQKGVHVSFALLGTPTITGDAPYNGQPELPLDVVGYKLTASIDNGVFNLTLEKGGQEVVRQGLRQRLRKSYSKFSCFKLPFVMKELFCIFLQHLFLYCQIFIFVYSNALNFWLLEN